MDPHRLAAVGWTGIVTTVVAIYLEGIALETASATEAALLFASEPVRASLFDVVDDLTTTRQAWTHKKQGYHGSCKQFGFENAVRCKMTSKTNMRRLSTVDCRLSLRVTTSKKKQEKTIASLKEELKTLKSQTKSAVNWRRSCVS
jgi:hypothetical protein